MLYHKPRYQYQSSAADPERDLDPKEYENLFESESGSGTEINVLDPDSNPDPNPDPKQMCKNEPFNQAKISKFETITYFSHSDFCNFVYN
jgi:hypothetical protein